jgi:DNA-binding NtrC family response regulator
MPGYEQKRRTVLHYGTDRVVLLSRARSLSEMGYRVLTPSNGFEAIKLASIEPVDAVVLDLDRDVEEVALVAREIKRCRPRVPTVLIADGAGLPGVAHELADALVPKRDDLEMLVTTLEIALTTGCREPSKSPVEIRKEL